MANTIRTEKGTNDANKTRASNDHQNIQHDNHGITVVEYIILGVVLLVPTCLYGICLIAVFHKIVALILFEEFRCELFLLLLLGAVLFSVIWYFIVGKIFFALIWREKRYQEQFTPTTKMNDRDSQTAAHEAKNAEPDGKSDEKLTGDFGTKPDSR